MEALAFLTTGSTVDQDLSWIIRHLWSCLIPFLEYIKYTHSSPCTKEILDPGIEENLASHKHSGHTVLDWTSEKKLSRSSYSSKGKPKPAIFGYFTISMAHLLSRSVSHVSWLEGSYHFIDGWDWITNTSHKWEVSALDPKARWKMNSSEYWGEVLSSTTLGAHFLGVPMCQVPVPSTSCIIVIVCSKRPPDPRGLTSLPFSLLG